MISTIQYLSILLYVFQSMKSTLDHGQIPLVRVYCENFRSFITITVHYKLCTVHDYPWDELV